MVTLYIATSIDGYIADKNGDIGWLMDFNSDESSYGDFIKEIDTIFLGSKTYLQIINELSVGVWPYMEQESYIFSTQKNLPNPHPDKIKIVNSNPLEFIKNDKNIWICGGASLAREIHNAGLIDRYHITIVPLILGSGIRLFEDGDICTRLKFIKSYERENIFEVVYTK